MIRRVLDSRLLLVVAAVAIGGSTLLLGIRSASAQTVPVTVTITRFIQIEDPDPGPGQGNGDYFGRVRIHNNPSERSEGTVTGSDIDPFWSFSANVDRSVGSVAITIEVIDSDGFANPNDRMDLNPTDEVTELTLVLDLETGNWTGDVPENQRFSEGDGDTEHTGIIEGGEQGKVFFEISTLSSSGDADDDGLLDSWEQDGLDFDGDGTIDVDLPAMGADPLHKDLFLELDWMNGQEPVRTEIQKMKDAFAAAPVDAGGTPNPDGQPGINLWVDTGNLTDSSGNLVGDDLGGGNSIGPAYDICGLNSDFYDEKSDNFDPNRRWVFRYALSGDGTNCDSGGQGEIGGNDFIDLNHDGGTIMHELGHNLNLRHGGNENDNCKPNYVSVMNYDNQFNIRQASGSDIIDFSPPRFAGGRGAAPLDSLDEGNLDESTVLDPTDSTNQFVFVDGNGAKVRNQLDQPVDWNGDGDTNDSGLSVNIDTASSAGNPEACENGSSGSTLTGHHDWDVISIPFRQFGDSADSAINPVTEPEITLEEMLELERELHESDLAIDKFDSDDPAVAGEELDYTLTVANNGPNPAEHVQVVDRLPEGTSYVSDDAGCEEDSDELVCDLGQLLADEEVDITVTVLIDANLVFDNGGPLTITNTAEVTSQDEFAEDINPGNNSVSEETEVVAEADLEIISFEETGAPSEILIGEPVEVRLDKTITNNGPSAPMDVDVDVDVSASGDAVITPGSDNPEEAPAVELGEERTLTETFTLACESPGEHMFTVSNSISPLNSADTDPNPDNNNAVEEITVNCVVPVAINIEPGGDPNPVNLRSRQGQVPLAVLTTEAGEYDLPLSFDATTIDPLSVTFGPADALFNTTESGSSELHERGHVEDAYELDEETLDGDDDMVLHFPVQDSGLEAGDTEACVKGEHTAGGETFTFFGCDSITTRPGS